MTSLHHSRINDINFMLQKSDYLSLYCKMLANPSVKSELLTLFLQYFYPLSTFFCFCYIADCWHSLLFYFSMKKNIFPSWSLTPFLNEFSKLSSSFGENIRPGKRWTGVDGLTFLNSCCVVSSAVLEKNRSEGKCCHVLSLLPQAFANIYIWRKQGSQWEDG